MKNKKYLKPYVYLTVSKIRVFHPMEWWENEPWDDYVNRQIMLCKIEMKNMRGLDKVVEESYQRWLKFKTMGRW